MLSLKIRRRTNLYIWLRQRMKMLKREFLPPRQVTVHSEKPAVFQTYFAFCSSPSARDIVAEYVCGKLFERKALLRWAPTSPTVTADVDDVEWWPALILLSEHGRLRQRITEAGFWPGHSLSGSFATVWENSSRILHSTARSRTPSPHRALHSPHSPMMYLIRQHICLCLDENFVCIKYQWPCLILAKLYVCLGVCILCIRARLSMHLRWVCGNRCAWVLHPRQSDRHVVWRIILH